MRVILDPEKRADALQERGLDFLDAPKVFAGVRFTFEDERFAYPEPRYITVQTTQIQYSQQVFLNFKGLTWPHVSVATLVPSNPIPVPPTVWA